jgi:hypothetical protein
MGDKGTSPKELADSRQELFGGENFAPWLKLKEGEIAFLVGLTVEEGKPKQMRVYPNANPLDEANDPLEKWNGQRLFDFILQRARLHSPEPRADSPAAAPAEQKSEGTIKREPIQPPLVTHSRPPSPESAIEKRRIAFEIVTSTGIPIPVQAGVASRKLVANRPFEVHFTLDLAKADPSQRKPLNYKANLHAKRLKGLQLESVGEKEGQLEPGKDTLIIKCNPLPQGVYRLQAVVSLSDPTSKSEHGIEIGENLLRVV